MKKVLFAICLALGLAACGGGGGSSGEGALSSSVSADALKAKTFVVDPTLAAQPVSVVNTTLAGEQGARAIGALPDGGYIVAWISGTTLLLQRYDSAGDKVGGEVTAAVTVPVADPIAIREGSVAVLSDGSIVVAYQVDVNVGVVGSFLQFKQSIYIQRFDPQGNQILGETEVFSRLELLTSRPNFLRAPSITALSDGGFVVAWLSDPPFLTNLSRSTLFKRRYDSQAQPVEPVETVGSFLLAATPRTGFRLVADASGGYTLSISSLDETFSLLPVSFIHYDESDVATQFTAPNVGDALLLPLRGDRFVLFGSGASGSFFQFLDAAGSPVAAPVAIAATPAAALELADGSFVVFWNNIGGVTAQRFDSAGVGIGDLLSVGSGGNIPLTSALADGGFASAWSALGALGDLDVFTQRFIENLTPDVPAMRAKRKACLVSARGMTGHERKAFMNACLAA